MFSFTEQNFRDALEQLKLEDRHGVKYKWPADHDFGKLERSIDELMFKFEQLPPLTWVRSFVNWLSRAIN